MLGRILKCRNFIFVKSVAQSDSDGLSSYLARKPIAVFVVRICDFSLKILHKIEGYIRFLRGSGIRYFPDAYENWP